MASPKPCHQTHHATMEQDGFAKTFAKRMNPTCHNAAPMPPNGLHLRLRPCHHNAASPMPPSLSPRVRIHVLGLCVSLGVSTRSRRRASNRWYIVGLTDRRCGLRELALGFGARVDGGLGDLYCLFLSRLLLLLSL